MVTHLVMIALGWLVLSGPAPATLLAAPRLVLSSQ